MCKKLNCWEFNNCGREPGGIMAEVHGVCPIAQAFKFDGINEGQAAGRVCWSLRDALPPDTLTCAQIGIPCHECTFYKRVVHEETGAATRRLVSTVA